MDDPADVALDAARKLRNDAKSVQAFEQYVEAASLARAAGNAQQSAHALRHVSDVGREIGKLPEALAAGQEAVNILRCTENSEPLDLANALRVTALALQELGQRERARPIWREAKLLYAKVGVDAGVAECEANL